MREFKELSIELIDESDNIRRSFSEEKLQELASSIRQRGVLKPLLVRPNGERFKLIDGWRRLSAAKLAECRTIPVRVRDVDENAAEEEMIIANLHHEDVTPLDEATSYQRLLDKGRTVDELAARLGKPRYIYQVLTLNRLVPEAQDLLARDILPLSYATELASVPADRQPEGLERCFRPLFGKEERQRDQLEPLAELSAWIEKSVRLDPRSEDAKVLLPELADQVAAAEQERDAAVLAIPTDAEIETELPPAVRVDSAPCPRLVSSSWQGLVSDRCGRCGSGASTQRAAEERWRTELRPRGLRLIASRTSKLAWSRGLIATLLEELNVDAMFTELVGRPQGLASRRYPQAIAVALALRHSWRREELVKFARRFGVKLTTKDLGDAANTDTADAPAPDADATGGAEASVH